MRHFQHQHYGEVETLGVNVRVLSFEELKAWHRRSHSGWLGPEWLDPPAVRPDLRLHLPDRRTPYDPGHTHEEAELA